MAPRAELTTRLSSATHPTTAQRQRDAAAPRFHPSGDAGQSRAPYGPGERAAALGAAQAMADHSPRTQRLAQLQRLTLPQQAGQQRPRPAGWHPAGRQYSRARPAAPAAGMASGPVLQPVWENVDEDVMKWDVALGGVDWYVNRLGMMWFQIVDETAAGANLPSYRALEGKIRSWNEWNQISVKPSPEWLQGQTDAAREALEEQERLESSGDSAWRTGHANKAFQQAAKVDPDGFNTGHHKLAKSTIEWVYQNLSEEQRVIARKRLDLPANAGLASFQSLFSNLTFGPLSAQRFEDPKRALDPNTRGPRLKRTLTPRSLEYFILNDYIAAIEGPGSASFDARAKRGFSESEFAFILDKMERAEKKHAIITKGGGLDTNTSMWSKSGSAEKPWGKVDSDVADIPEEHLSATVRELKSPAHQAVDANPRTFHPPRGKHRECEMSEAEYLNVMRRPDTEARRATINGGILSRNLHRMVMGKATSRGPDKWHHHWQLNDQNQWEWHDATEHWVMSDQGPAPLNAAARAIHERDELNRQI
ncbi:hypothetical protein [Pseudoduganella armeniaca]|nr:hypothetical protein [Pseudoduganella armeniaca]